MNANVQHSTSNVQRRTRNGSRGATSPTTSATDKYFLPYQVAWIEDEAVLKIVEKSRQIGFSYCDSYDSVCKAAVKGGKDVWVVSRDEAQAKQYVLYCKRWAKVIGYAAQDLGEQVFQDAAGKSIKVQVISFASGANIYALSSNPDAIVGKTGHVKLDEFALHKDQRTLYAVAKPVIQWGGTLSIISTHRGAMTVFNEIIKDIKERGNRMGWSLHTVPVQKAVDEGLVEKIDQATGGGLTKRYQAALKAKAPEPNVGLANGALQDASRLTLREWWVAQQRAEALDEESWLQEYCCVPADESSAFITYDMITSCEDDTARKDFEYLQKCDGALYIGYDVARTTDLSVITVLEKLGDVFWERLRIEMQGKTFDEQEQVFYRLMDLKNVRRACVDSTGLGMQMAERAINRFGSRVEAVRFSGAVKEELAFPLRAAHEDRRLRYNKDEKLRADLRGIKKTTTASGNIRFEGEAADSHCDRFWSLALAVHAGKSGGVEFSSALI